MYDARYLQSQVSTVGLITHYKLWAGPTTTGKVFDYSLRGHGGTLQGTSPTFKYPGLDLPGTNEYIEIADHADFTPALAPFSISAWVYMHDATNSFVATKGLYNTDGEWRFGTKADDKLHCRVFDENVNNCYLGREYSVALAENVWLHLVMTYSGGTTSASCKLYQNGIEVDDGDHQASAASFVTVQASGHAVWLGRNPAAFYANGLINDVMIFNVEKTATEVKSIYEVTRQRYGV